MYYLIFLFILIHFTLSAVIIENRNSRFKYFEPIPDSKLLSEDHLYWFNIGEQYLKRNINWEDTNKKQVAKNVVIFIGDGMGISTITATRIYNGQRNHGKSGEDHNLIYDNFPNLALVKTYNVDMQVPDSAGTATALFTGVKTRYQAVGVDVKCNKFEANPAIFKECQLEGIMNWAQKAGKATGIITTTRITHATPASTYAHVHFRDWECDSEIPKEFKSFVKDIGRQLIEDSPGNNFKVILGGGYQQLGYTTKKNSDDNCMRSDGLNLTQMWLDKHKGEKAAFVTNNKQLEDVGVDTEFLLGLFDPDHIPYDLLRDQGPQGTPSLYEMTKKGLQILKKSLSGFVLMVEGGRIDHGHHNNYARLALQESSEFEKTISLVLKETSPDTLIIVTADHSHSMTLNGYSRRGNDILGFGIENEDTKPALTLTYANGPGFDYHFRTNSSSILGPWIDVRNDTNRLNDPKFRHMATYDLNDETHGGEDVAMFAIGPGSHLVRGVIEQNYMAHFISYATCIGPWTGMNPECQNLQSSANLRIDTISLSFLTICALPLYYI